MMHYTGRMLIAAALVAGLSACGSPQEEPADQATTTATATETASPAADGRPASFAMCVSCHAVEKGKHGIGPSLAGVYGTKAGEIEGYAFSAPLKASGLTWDDATLDKWLESPAKLVPGSKMTFAGMTDPAKRKEVIEYLKTLK